MSKNLVLLASVSGDIAVAGLGVPGALPPKVTRVYCPTVDALQGALTNILAQAGSPQLVGAAIAVEQAEIDGQGALQFQDIRLELNSLREALGTPRVDIMDSLVASALAAPRLLDASLTMICSGTRRLGAAMAVVGPDMRAGVSFMAPDAAGAWLAIPSQGGLMGMASVNDREEAVLERMQAPPRAINDVISRRGLSAIFRAVRSLNGEPATDAAAANIRKLARRGDVCAIETLALFSRWLGGFSKAVALMGGAEGGVYLCSPLLTEMGDLIDREQFALRYRGESRAEPYLHDVPVFLVPTSMALVGLSTLFQPGDQRFGLSGEHLLDG